MQTLRLNPTIHYFDTVRDWHEAFPFTKKDLVITNEWLYKPYFEDLGANPNVIFQEKYGTGEPTDEMIDAIVKEAKQYSYDSIVAFGGGVIIDIGKVLALDVPERSEDLFMGKVPMKKIKRLVACPTTCGTGSEVTNISIAELKSLGIKKGLVGDEVYPDKAVLIPETLHGLPHNVFVTSSIDALIHAVESYLSPKASTFTELFSRGAIRRIMQGYKEIMWRGEEARFEHMGDFLTASAFAGIAFGNAGCGAVHALSYSIGGAFHVPHGEANYQFFLEVLKLYNRKAPDGKIRRLTELLAEIFGLYAADTKTVYATFDAFLSKIIEKKPLHEYGMTEPQIDEFAKSTIENQQRLLANNYVPIDEDEFREIFRKLF